MNCVCYILNWWKIIQFIQIKGMVQKNIWMELHCMESPFGTEEILEYVKIMFDFWRKN